ncbi:MAG: DapH/DapD/GlmU-related protein [Patescibacteria group bacterium]|jgi:NDP-sugar pyrophosphorylase family protein
MFKPSTLFDLKHTAHRLIFFGVANSWEVLPKIQEYCEKHLHPENAGTMIGDPYIEWNVQIGEGTVIEPNVMIKGPTIIGKDCHIRSGAYIRGNTIIGDRVVVGNSTEIKNSLLFNDVAVPHYNYIGDSILGYKVHLGAGVILSNVTIPAKEIKIATMEKKHATGLKKFGALIGDNTEVGCNAVLNPGTVLGKGCLVYPGIMFRGMAPANAIIKLRQEQEVVIKQKIR